MSNRFLYDCVISTFFVSFGRMKYVDVLFFGFYLPKSYLLKSALHIESDESGPVWN
jgi:hypothetical protein